MAASRPRVIMSAAVSMDGRIATRAGDSRLSSPADARRVHRLRASADAILVGRRTVEADDPLLTVRLARGPDPLRVVLSSRARVPPGSRIARTARRVPTLVACSGLAPRAARRRLEAAGAEVLVAGRREVRLRRLLSELHARGARSVLVEGGGATNWGFLREGLVDEAVIAVAPVALGGRGAPPLVGGAGFAAVAGAPRFRLDGASRLGGMAVLRYSKP